MGRKTTQLLTSQTLHYSPGTYAPIASQVLHMVLYCKGSTHIIAHFTGSTVGVPGEANPWTRTKGKVVDVVLPEGSHGQLFVAELSGTGGVTYKRIRGAPSLEHNMHGSYMGLGEGQPTHI